MYKLELDGEQETVRYVKRRELGAINGFNTCMRIIFLIFLKFQPIAKRPYYTFKQLIFLSYVNMDWIVLENIF